MTAPPKGLGVQALQDWLDAEIARCFAEAKDGSATCRHCGSRAFAQTLVVSIHSEEFGAACAGQGRVYNVGVPRCPVCEPAAPAHIYTCVHLPLFAQTLASKGLPS